MGKNVAPEAAALVETLAVVHRAVRLGRITANDRVAVIGGGTVGQIAVQVAISLGVREAVLVEPLSVRRALGTRFGATVLSPDETADVEADVILECSGSAGGFHVAVATAARGARLVLVGIHDRPLPLSVLTVVARELEIYGSMSYTFEDDFIPAAGLVGTGDVTVEPLITDRVGLADSIENGFDALLTHPDEHLKIIVMPALSGVPTSEAT